MSHPRASSAESLLADAEFPRAPDPVAASTPRPCTAVACAAEPLALWTFDDCGEDAAELTDSSAQRTHGAVRSPQLQCTEGWQGGAIAFTRGADPLAVPDQPDLQFADGVTVAAWVKPSSLDGVQTLVRKRAGDESAFVLLLEGDEYRFAARLDSGRAVSIAAAATRDRWTHVAATYDGSTLRLYLDGAQVAERSAGGKITAGQGPVLIGNDGAGRHFEGALDNLWINTWAAPAAVIAQLTCQRRTPAFEVTSESSEPVEPGTEVTYTLSIENRNEPSCEPEVYLASVTPPEGQGFRAEPGSLVSPPLAAGEIAALQVVVSSRAEEEPGTFPLDFFIRSQASPGVARAVLSSTAASSYVVREPEGCYVAPSRTLLVRDPSVVDDPVRTTGKGAWTFGYLMEQLAPSPEEAPDIAEAMLQSFATPQEINGFAVRARPNMRPSVLEPWPRTAAGKLDLARAPMRLLAIAHRLDLASFEQGRAGEGRFVFGVLGQNGSSLLFTIIFEYALPARYDDWGRAVHALQREAFPSDGYNRALQALAERYTLRGAVPDAPNGSALLRVRTNENSLGRDGLWEMREFHLARDTGRLVPAVLQQTPDRSFKGSTLLARFIDDNQSRILAETHDLPARLDDAPFQAGALINQLDHWDAPGIQNSEARYRFSLNTCDGCHGGETFTSFFHVFPRGPGEQSLLSGFLTGVVEHDPATGEERPFNELARRGRLLERTVCGESR